MTTRLGDREGGCCALCGLLLPHGQFAHIITVGREGEKVKVCADGDACRRRAVEIVRGYEKMQLNL